VTAEAQSWMINFWRKPHEGYLASERLAAMLRWFLFLTAILLFTLGSALAALILVSPVNVKKDDDDE